MVLRMGAIHADFREKRKLINAETKGSPSIMSTHQTETDVEITVVNFFLLNHSFDRVQRYESSDTLLKLWPFLQPLRTQPPQ